MMISWNFNCCLTVVAVFTEDCLIVLHLISWNIVFIFLFKFFVCLLQQI